MMEVRAANHEWGKFKAYYFPWINAIYRFSNISRSTRAVFKFPKTEKLVRDFSERYDSSTLGSVSLRSGFDGCMFGAKFVQAAMGSCLEKCNGRVPIHFHTNSTSLNSNQGKI